MTSPSPELLRKFRNTEGLILSNKSYLVSDMVYNYPQDYVDIETYRSMKRML